VITRRETGADQTSNEFKDTTPIDSNINTNTNRGRGLQVTKKLFKDTILQETVDGASGEDNWRIRERARRENQTQSKIHTRGVWEMKEIIDESGVIEKIIEERMK
jgi:hypothetical protein